MNDFFEENKKKIITIGIIVAITIVIAVGNLVMNKSTIKSNSKKALEELGKIYYEELYYPYLKKTYSDEYKNMLTDYSDKGIKVTLSTLLTSVENSSIEPFYNSKKNTSCDLTLTYITIFPKASYDVKNYTIETTLKCDIGVASESDSTNESGE